MQWENKIIQKNPRPCWRGKKVTQELAICEKFFIRWICAVVVLLLWMCMSSVNFFQRLGIKLKINGYWMLEKAKLVERNVLKMAVTVTVVFGLRIWKNLAPFYWHTFFIKSQKKIIKFKYFSKNYFLASYTFSMLNASVGLF